jgi:N-formylglutamate deformylase
MMDEVGKGAADLLIPGVLYRLDPKDPTIPLVVDSPHNGVEWPEDFAHQVTEAELMTSVDAFVDELFAHAPEVGGTLIAALFPRAYIDPNRAEDDLDETLVDGDWPHPLNPSQKTEYGMGVVRRIILKGRPLYDAPLTVEAVMRRLDAYYRPYHDSLAEALDRAVGEHGQAFHINAHSMKPVGNAMNLDAGVERPDFVISDREGETSGHAFRDQVVMVLRDLGYHVSINDPYKGAEIVRRHGDPARDRHSLQIEINRKLYMSGDRFERTDAFPRLKADLDVLLTETADWIRARISR